MGQHCANSNYIMICGHNSCDMDTKIRIGKDFKVHWSIYAVVDGQRQPYNLAGKDLKLEFRNIYESKMANEWEVKDNVVVWTFRGKDQKALGQYQLILTQNGGKDGMLTVDTCNAFILVARSCEETRGQEGDIAIEDVVIESEVTFAPVVSDGGKTMEMVTYAQLRDMRDAGELVPGMQYRITDFVTTSVQENTRSAGNQFDIIVTADSANTLNEVARACLHEGDTYFSGYEAKLEAWQIWYSLDNDATRFAWAANPETQYVLWHEKNVLCAFHPMEGYYGESQVIGLFDAFGCEHYCTPDFQVIDESEMPEGSCEIVEGSYFKGVIYRMIDEHGNECPYDFKNIQFYTECYDDGTPTNGGDGDYSEFLYTFSWMAEGRSHDLSLEFVDLYTDEGFATSVRNNIIKSCYAGDELVTQTLNRIVLGAGFEVEDGYFYDMKDNTFDTGCMGISLARSCSHNSFGKNCFSIHISNSSNNYFGHRCALVSLDECYENNFRDNCYNIKLKSGSQYNEFGMGVRQLMFHGINTIRSCIFEPEVNDLDIYPPSGYYNIDVRNYRFCSGLYNAQVTVYPDLIEQTYVTVHHGDGHVVSFALSELINS